MNCLGRLLEELPVVALSPYALVAYLATVAAWLLVSYRVNRNRNLLQHLQKVPAEKRESVLKVEIGGAYLRAGMTAEQFLRYQMHRYLFWGFLAVLGSIVTV